MEENQSEVVRELRRKRLQELIDADGGIRKNFAQRKNIAAQRLANYLNPALTSFGSRAARALEKDLNLPTYYFDASTPSAKTVSPTLYEVKQEPAQYSAVDPGLQIAELVRLYAAASPSRRKAILALAMAAEVQAKPEAEQA